MLSFALLARYVLLDLKWEYIHIPRFIILIPCIHLFTFTVFILASHMREASRRSLEYRADYFRKFLNVRAAFAVNGFGTVTVFVIKITNHETPLSIRKYCYFFRYKYKSIAVKTQRSFGFNICVNIAADKLCLSTVIFCVRDRPERISRRKITADQDRIHQDSYPKDVAG